MKNLLNKYHFCSFIHIFFVSQYIFPVFSGKDISTLRVSTHPILNLILNRHPIIGHIHQLVPDRENQIDLTIVQVLHIVKEQTK
jgi:hypothetical protein